MITFHLLTTGFKTNIYIHLCKDVHTVQCNLKGLRGAVGSASDS